MGIFMYLCLQQFNCKYTFVHITCNRIASYTYFMIPQNGEPLDSACKWHALRRPRSVL